MVTAFCHCSGVAGASSPVAMRSSSELRSTGQLLLEELLATGLVLEEDWDNLPEDVRSNLQRETDRKMLLKCLVEEGLLTDYQANRIATGKTYGMMLGPYRVLDRLGVGGMGAVFKAEHVRMRRLVAIKTLLLYPDDRSQLLSRFYAEMRAVARLHHPNIVAAIDVGEVHSTNPDEPTLHYLVMDLVTGRDLEEYVNEEGPLPPYRACGLIYQIASALAEAHKHNLVHRDVKPSNIMVTAEDQAKLLDFGLVRRFGHRLTEPNVTLGTVEYMAPEQVRDAHGVDIRADIYGLGGTLYWALTGRLPFPPLGTPSQNLMRRLTQPPPSVRASRPEVPAELDAVVARMMACEPQDRYDTPQAVMAALLPWLDPAGPNNPRRTFKADTAAIAAPLGTRPLGCQGRRHHALLVDDQSEIRTICRMLLQAEGIECLEAGTAEQALQILKAQPIDLILLDVNMPGQSGLDFCRQLRAAPPCPHLKIVMLSGCTGADELARMLEAGADDYLCKPFSMVQLQARLKAALRLKDAQEQSDALNQQLREMNAALERDLTARDSDLIHARNTLVLALGRLVEQRDPEIGARLHRMRRYSRCLAEVAATLPSFAGQIDDHFVRMLECWAPLHDLGKVALPDHILHKPGKLDPDERIIMQSHTIIGAETLAEVARQDPSNAGFLQMAIDIARHHHECYDGTGYPDRLSGSAIPLPARLVTIADVYDALRCRRPYRPALSHAAAVQVMGLTARGQFDPALLHAFELIAPQFEQIFRDSPS